MQILGFNAYAMAVLGKAADLFGIEPQEIRNRTRRPKYAWPRMAAAWALREADPRKDLKGSSFKTFSLGRLASVVGWDNHTTALNAIRRVPELRASDPNFKAKTDELLAFAMAHRPMSMLRGW